MKIEFLEDIPRKDKLTGMLPTSMPWITVRKKAMSLQNAVVRVAQMSVNRQGIWSNLLRESYDK